MSLDPQTLDPSLEGSFAPREHRRVRVGPVSLPAPSVRDITGAIRQLRVDLARPGPIRTGRLAGLSMGAAIWTLAWPVLAESTLNSTIALVDTFLAAHLPGPDAADAVGAAAYLLWFVGLITMAIGVGATALISRSMGAGRTAVARAALGQSMLMALIGGVATGAALAIAAPALAGLMSLSPSASAEFVRYIWAYGVGVPCSTLLFAGTACCRGAGDTVRPLRVMAVVNVVNLGAAWTLSHVLGLGVVGIGLGTALAHLVGAALILRALARGTPGVMLRWRWLTPHRVTIYRLLRLGMPNFFETFGMWVANFLVILMVGWMSAASLRAAPDGQGGGLIGAHLIAIRIEAFSFLGGFAMGIAAGALAGQYLGAGAPLLARRAALVCAGVAATIMGLMGLVMIFVGPTITGLVSEQSAHLQMTPTLLLITGLIQVPFALAIVLRSTLHGAGDVRAVMWMTWISQWGLRVPMAYAFSGVEIPLPAFLGGAPGQFIANPFPFNWGLPGLWIGLCAEICIRCALYAWRFAGNQWMHARV